MGIRLIVGLGNPGPEYAGTRHNAGFMVVDALGDELGARYWKSEGGALCAHVKHGGEELLLAKPQSFMNASGGPVSKLASAYGVKPQEILVIHDELDIPAGDVRIKSGGGHAGHNGLRSIHSKLNSDAYQRVRVGIGRPPGRMPVADYVLNSPRGDEQELLKVAVATAVDAVMAVVDHGPVKAMNSFNQR